MSFLQLFLSWGCGSQGLYNRSKVWRIRKLVHEIFLLFSSGAPRIGQEKVHKYKPLGPVANGMHRGFLLLSTQLKPSLSNAGRKSLRVKQCLRYTIRTSWITLHHFFRELISVMITPPIISTALLLNEVSEKSREIWNKVSEIFSEIGPEIRPDFFRAFLAGRKVLP